MIRILIADDHAVVRHGISQIVTVDNQMMIAGEASNGNDLLDLVRKTAVDVVILDINMPGRNGLETLKELKRDYPSLPVIILSMHSEDQYAVRALKAGAAGYMNKEAAPDELVAAIKKVYRGGKYISPQIAELLVYHIGGNHQQEPHKSLSDRELEVFYSLAGGKTVGQISEELNLSVKTVSTYRTRILEKMNMTTNAELVRYAFDYKLL
jgi:DNA-binding NarL/FixJ family response regulator